MLSAGAELGSHLGDVIDRLKVRSHTSCFPSIFCWYMLETPAETSFECGLKKILTDIYSRR